MGMVAAICTQCGAAIKVDESKEAGICPHCGTAFITEKVVNNYVVNNTVNNVIENANIGTAIFKSGKGVDDYFRRYIAFIEQKKICSRNKIGDSEDDYGFRYCDTDCAVGIVQKMEKLFPDKNLTALCRAYLLIAYHEYSEYDFDDFGDNDSYDNYDKALSDYEAQPDEYYVDKVIGYYKNTDAELLIKLCEEKKDKSVWDSIEFFNKSKVNGGIHLKIDEFEWVEHQYIYLGDIDKISKNIKKIYAKLTDAEKTQYSEFIKMIDEKREQFEKVYAHFKAAQTRAVRVNEKIYTALCSLRDEKIKNRKKGANKKKIIRLLLAGGIIIAVAVIIILCVK